MLFVMDIYTQHLADKLLQLQEAPQFIEPPDGLHTYACITLYQVEAVLQHNPIAVNLRVTAALLKHHALLTEPIKVSDTIEERVSSKHFQFLLLLLQILYLAI